MVSVPAATPDTFAVIARTTASISCLAIRAVIAGTIPASTVAIASPNVTLRPAVHIEPVVQVERLRRAFPGPAARQQGVRVRTGPEVVDDGVDRGRTVAAALEPVIDKEPPQEVRPDDVAVGVEDLLRDAVA